MKACCCCSARIGSFVGLTLSVIFSLAFGGFFWSGGAENFSVDAATRAIEFCRYPKNITAAYREPSVCNHDKDPCTLVDDVTATIDDYTEDITTQNALGGLFGVPLLLGIIAAHTYTSSDKCWMGRRHPEGISLRQDCGRFLLVVFNII